MATRTRRKWAPDPRGYYSRQIGWISSKTGKQQQHKFILGKDKKQAEIRERKLRELWEQHEADSDAERPQWPENLLAIAKQIAKGVSEFHVPRGPRERQMSYTGRLQRMQAKYPVISFVPEDQRAYEIGLAALESFDDIPSSDDLDSVVQSLSEIDAAKVQAWKEGHETIESAGISMASKVDVRDIPPSHSSSDGKSAETRSREISGAKARGSKTPSASLHQAIRKYQKFIRQEFHRPETDQVTAWGRTQVRQLDTLIKHHPDRLLVLLDAAATQEMVAYWRRRPCKLGTKTPMKAKSCSNYVKALMRFFKWLDTARDFDWNKPMALNDLDTRIRSLAVDHATKSLEQVQTFAIDDLQLLMKYGQPMDRMMLLLALNCGFGNAEIASLLIGEVHLFSAHSDHHQELLGIKTTEEDSFIKRVRRKSGVYGEHLLFPMTVTGIQWVLAARESHEKTDRLLLSENGLPLDQQTVSGNANQAIANRFERLKERVREDGNELRNLSFGKLRKTATHFIRLHSSGEIAGVFDCHGKPVASDSLSDQYSVRPFAKVFQAIRDVESYLAPVFKEAGASPFASQAQAYTKRSTIDQVIAMHEAGRSISDIANTVNLSSDAVRRHLTRSTMETD